ncbi:formyl transferase [Flagellimonas aequoris]|uniref:Formyl transferase n=1 Tax=Flagellimonas aequoris TaxID=2306997 RepID=A0A418NBZ2_9FLAO|nr:formyl transferase [Allomuricauda aequoris]RIV74391.1 formyl transferase [Allomuricauda aequoris]TXK08513.1 formyl transferase [Allomuricauda aequoris]
MDKFNIIMFTGGGDLCEIVYDFLEKNYAVQAVIIDSPVPKKTMIKRRIKRLGMAKVFSQLLFMKGVVPILNWESRNRRKKLLAPFTQSSIFKSSKIHFPDSINSSETIDIVNKFQPDLIVVCGTRLISKKIIDSIRVPIINMHVGITPKYRGVHGGYWALCNNDKENCGVTVHLIDPGIDTGGVLSQKTIEPTRSDNYSTYPILQAIKGVECLKESINYIKEGKVNTINNNLPSKLYYHPTIWQYLYYRFVKGIK